MISQRVYSSFISKFIQWKLCTVIVNFYILQIDLKQNTHLSYVHVFKASINEKYIEDIYIMIISANEDWNNILIQEIGVPS